MKLVIATAATVAFLAGSALAQTGGNMEPRSPAYQNGGSDAGGPANELNPNQGMPATTGTVNRRNTNQSNTGRDVSKQDLNTREPAYQKGGSDAGGPANELNRR